MVLLEQGPAQLSLLPEVGGAIGRFRVGEVDILRATVGHPTDALQTACFPMLPLVNRVPGDEFTFGEQRVVLPKNAPGGSEFLHGHGWREPWQVVNKTNHSAQLLYHHAADHWPWPYTARQTFSVRDDGLTVALEVINESDHVMPVCAGFHPYFPRRTQDKIQTIVKGMWLADERVHPIKKVDLNPAFDFSEGVEVSSLAGYDHCFFGAKNRFLLLAEDGPTVEVTIDKRCGNLHIYVPKNEDYFAVEPMLGRADPFGIEPPEFTLLKAGECLTLTMQLTVMRE